MADTEKTTSEVHTNRSNPSEIEIAAAAHAREFVISISFGVLVAIFVAVLTFRVWKSGNRLQDAIRHDADVKIEEARRDIKKLESENLSLQKEVEEERSLRIKTEESVAWRRLTKKQQSEIGAKLRQFANETGSVWFNATDVEGSNFALDITSAMREAKWIVEPESGASLGGGGPAKTGVEVISTGDESSVKAAELLVRELVALGFDAMKSDRTHSSPIPMVEVRVASRPLGPQGEAKLRKGHK